MFVCRECNKDNSYDRDWMFDLAMAISFGRCEICKGAAPCIDIKFERKKEVNEDEI